MYVAATFSKGMKQKLAIARALLHEPRTIFLDEPTAGLDPEASRLVREFILEIKGEGRTIFICTHNLDEADRLCDRIGVFKTRLLVIDSPVNLRRQVFGRKVVFHLHQADQKLVDKIENHPDVTEARLVDGKIVATINDPEAHNPELIRLMVAEGAEIQFVGELRRSLEDVYLQLVKEN
jgi:ABC-2 type transport system ATP-binding protein